MTSVLNELCARAGPPWTTAACTWRCLAWTPTRCVRVCCSPARGRRGEQGGWHARLARRLTACALASQVSGDEGDGADGGNDDDVWSPRLQQARRRPGAGGRRRQDSGSDEEGEEGEEQGEGEDGASEVEEEQEEAAAPAGAAAGAEEEEPASSLQQAAAAAGAVALAAAEGPALGGP